MTWGLECINSHLSFNLAVKWMVFSTGNRKRLNNILVGSVFFVFSLVNVLGFVSQRFSVFLSQKFGFIGCMYVCMCVLGGGGERENERERESMGMALQHPGLVAA